MQLVHSRETIVSATDSLLIIWLLYCIANAICCTAGFSSIYPFLFIFGCYFVARFFRTCPHILFWGIMGIGIWQSSLAIIQNIGWAAGNNEVFIVTGSFSNPGQLGGFLSVSTICTLCLGLQQDRKAKWFIMLPLFLIQGYALILSDSRAGWIASIGGGLFLFWNYTISFRSKIKSSWLIKIVFCILLIVTLWGLYSHKPHSANGRLLVWRTSIDMIADKPLLGHGIGSFNRKYMLYQADYFANHPDSMFQQYADNVIFPFNEFLYIWVEQGAVGLLLLLSLVVCVLLIPAENNSYKGALIAYTIFASFSYPSQIPGLLFLFPVLLASIHSQPLSINLPKKVYLGFIIVTLFSIGLTGKEYLFREQSKSKIQDLFSSSPSKVKEAETFIFGHYERVLTYPQIADIFAHYAFRHYEQEQAMAILNDVRRVMPTSELYCELGDLYKTERNYNSARECYLIASRMIPRRMTPKYKLFALLRENGDTLSARRQGKEILSMPIRIEGTRVLRMKTEVRQFIETTE